MSQEHLDARFFPDSEALRGWLEENHDALDAQWIGLYKKASGKASITWPELVAELLCFGWIDGLRRSVDRDSYAIRATPRREGSDWSERNVGRVTALVAEGRMTPAGMAAFEVRDPERDQSRSARESVRLNEDLEGAFRANEPAWEYFSAESDSYRRTAAAWVMAARRRETRVRRLGVLIEDSEQGRRIAPLRRRP